MPAPPHVSEPGQEPPQERVPPQPSGGVPQLSPRLAQVAGVHVHAFVLVEQQRIEVMKVWTDVWNLSEQSPSESIDSSK
jgi:hypothetical protein